MSRSTLYLLTLFLSAGCYSSNISVPKPIPSTGKRIAIGNIYTTNIKKPKKNVSQDTLCVCVAQSIQDAFIPYLQQAGFTVVTLPITPKMDLSQMLRVADSSGVDYLLAGKAQVEAKNYRNIYTETLNANIIDMRTKAVVANSSYTNGVDAIKPAKAAGRLGKKLLRELKKN